MRHSAVIVAIGLSAVTFMARADESPIYTTGAFGFSVSEITGGSISIRTSGAKSLACLLGENVVMTAPDGATSTLPAVDGACSWTPTAGGTWSFSNSAEGDAVLTVRYSLFPGTQGEGTVSDPVKLVDDDELADLLAGGIVAEGSAFTLRGPNGIGSLAIPSGYAADGAADGIWRLVAASGGLLYGSLPASCIVDSAKPGPDRTVRDPKHTPPFAYTGDGWCGDPSAVSTLTFVSPGGVTTKEENCVGTGALAYELPRGIGVWTVTLACDGETLVCHLNRSGGLSIILR